VEVISIRAGIHYQYATRVIRQVNAVISISQNQRLLIFTSDEALHAMFDIAGLRNDGSVGFPVFRTGKTGRQCNETKATLWHCLAKVATIASRSNEGSIREGMRSIFSPDHFSLSYRRGSEITFADSPSPLTRNESFVTVADIKILHCAPSYDPNRW